MTIDQMIARLKVLKQQEGNVPVYFDSMCGNTPKTYEVDGIYVYPNFDDNGNPAGVLVQVY